MAKNDKIIKAGSKIQYRGNFGMDKPTTAIVKQIERSKYKRDKYGEIVPEIPFSEREHGVFVLDNCHWCYGEQIDEVIEG